MYVFAIDAPLIGCGPINRLIDYYPLGCYFCCCHRRRDGDESHCVTAGGCAIRSRLRECASGGGGLVSARQTQERTGESDIPFFSRRSGASPGHGLGGGGVARADTPQQAVGESRDDLISDRDVCRRQ